MPTYDYRCNSCAAEFEVFQRITAEPGATCPRCGSPARRLVSGGTGLIFKGTGFYITDYKRQGAQGGEAAEAAASQKSPSPGAAAAPATPVTPAAGASGKTSKPSSGSTAAAPSGAPAAPAK